MRVAIVDDVLQDAEALRGMLAGRVSNGGFMDVYASAEALLRSGSRYDLLFLDVNMRGMSGVECARRLRERDIRCLIVFVTESREYVWDALPLHPFDYLVKPVEDKRLAELMADVERALMRDAPTISVKVGRQRESFPLSQIISAAARDHYVYLKLKDGRELRCYMTFAEMRAQLEADARFLTCNRGIIINMDEVRAFDGESFTMNDMQRYTLRLRERARISETFYQYTFRRMRGLD